MEMLIEPGRSQELLSTKGCILYLNHTLVVVDLLRQATPTSIQPLSTSLGVWWKHPCWCWPDCSWMRMCIAK